MQYKIFLKKVILFGSLFFIFSLLFFRPDYIGMCQERDYKCIDFFGEIFQSVGTISLMLAIISSVLIFLPEHIFKAVKRFSYFYLPLMLFWIFITPTSGGGLGPDREGILYFTSSFYLLGIGLIFLYKFIKFIFLKVRTKIRIKNEL